MHLDEQVFMARVRQAVARTAPGFGELMSDHVRAMQRHGGPAGDSTGAAHHEAGSLRGPAFLGELLGLPDPDDHAGLVTHWSREFRKLGGFPQVAENTAEAVAAIVVTVTEVLTRRGGYCIVTSHPLTMAWGLPEALRRSGSPVEVYRSDADRQKLAEASVGVHVASAAIAETGTLVIESHSDQGRYSSLLPPVHIAVVAPGTLHPGVAGWLVGRGACYRAGEEMPSSIVFATGPSRSADIAGDLTLGVHGPGEVHAVLVRE